MSMLAKIRGATGSGHPGQFFTMGNYRVRVTKLREAKKRGTEQYLFWFYGVITEVLLAVEPSELIVDKKGNPLPGSLGVGSEVKAMFNLTDDPNGYNAVELRQLLNALLEPAVLSSVMSEEQEQALMAAQASDEVDEDLVVLGNMAISGEGTLFAGLTVDVSCIAKELVSTPGAYFTTRSFSTSPRD